MLPACTPGPTGSHELPETVTDAQAHRRLSDALGQLADGTTASLRYEPDAAADLPWWAPLDVTVTFDGTTTVTTVTDGAADVATVARQDGRTTVTADLATVADVTGWDELRQIPDPGLVGDTGAAEAIVTLAGGGAVELTGPGPDTLRTWFPHVTVDRWANRLTVDRFTVDGQTTTYHVTVEHDGLGEFQPDGPAVVTVTDGHVTAAAVPLAGGTVHVDVAAGTPDRPEPDTSVGWGPVVDLARRLHVTGTDFTGGTFDPDHSSGDDRAERLAGQALQSAHVIRTIAADGDLAPDTLLASAADPTSAEARQLRAALVWDDQFDWVFVRPAADGTTVTFDSHDACVLHTVGGPAPSAADVVFGGYGTGTSC